jgi:hypothetical protein
MTRNACAQGRMKGDSMGFFNLMISEKEREELFRLLQDSLPESRLDRADLTCRSGTSLIEGEEELVRELLDKIKKAKPRLWYSRLVAHSK